MTTEVSQPVIAPMAAPIPIPVEPISEAPVATNGVEQNGNGQPANGESKNEKNGTAKKEKEAEPPKDLRTDPVGWLTEQGKQQLHTAAYRTAQWVVDVAYADGEKKPELPANGQLTRSQFVNLFKDGEIFGKLANRLKPGAVESPKEGDNAESKSIQKSNIDAFTSVAKEHLPDHKVFSSEDLEKGKSQFSKIFETLFLLAQQAQEKFQIQGINVDQFAEELEKIVPKGMAEKFRDWIARFLPGKKSVEANKNVEQPAQNGEPIVSATEEHVTTATPTTNLIVEEKKEEIVPIATVN